MTVSGICDSATFPHTRLSPSKIRRLKPVWRRTITYWRDDDASWRAVLEACRDAKELGVKNLVLFNTEASGCVLDDVDGQARALERFLLLAQREYGSPVDAIEAGNELDTPGWDDGDDDDGDGVRDPITADLIVGICGAFHIVARRFDVQVWGPSFLGAPTSTLVQESAQGLARQRVISAFSIHMYGRSIAGQPWPGFAWGSIEDGINELLPVLGDLPLAFTEGGCWSIELGEQAQANYVRAYTSFQHPRVLAMFLFCLNDGMLSIHDRAQARDFGLWREDGREKLAVEAFQGTLVPKLPDAPKPEFVLGFRKFAAVLGAKAGTPLENEWGAWPGQSQQLTTTGVFTWSDLATRGGSLSFIGHDGQRYRWDERWPSYEVLR